MLRIAARVESNTRDNRIAASSKDAWFDNVIKPLTALKERASSMIKFLDDLGPESGAEIEESSNRLRSGLLEMSKDVSRTTSKVADLIARGA